MAEHDPDIAERIAELRAELLGRSGYLPVLVLLLASTVCGLLIGDSHLGAVISTALTAGALLTAVFRSTESSHARAGGLAFAIFVAAVVALSPQISSHDRASAGWLALVAYLVLIMAALPLVLVRALRHRRITLNTLCATVSAYLLLGMLFAATYRLYSIAAPPFFAQDPGVEACRGPDPPRTCPTAGQYTYFSFITLATVGYGDLTPGSDPARAFVTLESITGQVFVITALARVVSLLGEERPRLTRTTNEADG